MKKLLSIHFLLLLSLGTQTVSAAPFQNLNFESATLFPNGGDPYNRIDFNPAFPAWRGYVGSVQETRAWYNNYPLCCSAITLLGNEVNHHPQIAGTFSVRIQASIDPDSDPRLVQPADTTLAQTGLVPVAAQSLLFNAIVGGSFAVSLEGQPLVVIPLSRGPNYTTFGADISHWANQVAELRFTALAGDQPAVGGSVLILDSITFSPEAVPEPYTWALLAMAGGFGWCCWRRKA